MPPTTYHLRNESGIEVFTGTIDPAPGGGSSAVLSASVTRTDAQVNAANSQANGVEIVPAPSPGELLVPVLLVVATATPDGTGNASLLLGYGASGSSITPAGSIFFSGGNGIQSTMAAQAFAVASDFGLALRVWTAGGSVDVPTGPYVITVLYTVTATA